MVNRIYIGDNKTVLESKINQLRESIDIIYIDPPYNTIFKKSYKDHQYSNETWKEMMYPRLLLGKEILKKSGVIFISIDDNQYANLKVMCDEIFDEKNFLGVFITKQAQRSNSKHINTVHEYVLTYAKNKKDVPRFETLRIDDIEDGKMIKDIISKVKITFDKEGTDAANIKLKELIKYYCELKNITWLRNYNRISDDGRVFFGKDLSTPSKPRAVNLPEINLVLEPLSTRGWSSDEKFIDLYNRKRLDYRGERPYEIAYLEESKDNVSTILNFYSRQGTNDLNSLGLRDLFDTPKPVNLIKYLINIYPGESHVICDFFAGSGTTAQAVLELNEDYGYSHEFVLIQSEEKLLEDSAPYIKAVELGLKPQVDDIMIHRINKFVELRKLKNINIEIERLGE